MLDTKLMKQTVVKRNSRYEHFTFRLPLHAVTPDALKIVLLCLRDSKRWIFGEPRYLARNSLANERNFSEGKNIAMSVIMFREIKIDDVSLPE